MANNPQIQITTDINPDSELLTILLEDMKNADEIWKPGPYWKEYVERNSRILCKKDSLDNFRNINLKGFSVGKPGASLYSKKLSMLLRIIERIPILKKIPGAIHQELSTLSKSYLSYIQRLEYTMYHYAKSNDKSSVLPRIQDSGLGNPFDIFTINEKRYSINFLKKFLHYVYVCDKIDFSKVGTMLEVGGGYGAQAEVVLQIHPNIKYILVDIPPQIYITERYLKTIHPGKVLGYGETKQQKYLDIHKYKENIFILAPWQMPSVNQNIDLFWNCASFQEMTGNIIEEYLHYVKKIARTIYLCTLEYGHKQSRNISAEFLKNKLLGDFSLIEERLADDIIGDSIKNRYMHIVLKSKNFNKNNIGM